MNFGIIGAGDIANAMATTLNALEETNLYAIASRDIGRANEFKNKYNAEKSYGSYAEMVEDENIDVVYIATPHAFHFERT